MTALPPIAASELIGRQQAANGHKRNGIDSDRYRALEDAFRALRNGDKSLEGIPDMEEVGYLREWLSVKTKYGHYEFVTRSRKKK